MGLILLFVVSAESHWQWSILMCLIILDCIAYSAGHSPEQY